MSCARKQGIASNGSPAIRAALVSPPIKAFRRSKGVLVHITDDLPNHQYNLEIFCNSTNGKTSARHSRLAGDFLMGQKLFALGRSFLPCFAGIAHGNLALDNSAFFRKQAGRVYRSFQNAGKHRQPRGAWRHFPVKMPGKQQLANVQECPGHWASLADIQCAFAFQFPARETPFDALCP